MKFSTLIWCTEDSIGPAEVARAAEDTGFEALFFPDHTHIPVSRRSPWPGGGEMPAYPPRIYDPIVAMGAAAAATTRLKVGVGVAIIPERDPIVLAKQVASLDVLSGGRVLLGVGAGWNEEEAANHGIDPRTRWGLMRERVLAMKAIWTQEVAEFHGKHVDIAPLWSWPKPRQKPHPPIILGGWAEGALKRAVAYADEFMPIPPPMPDVPRDQRFAHWKLEEQLATLRSMARAAGRAPIPVTVSVSGFPPREDEIERFIALGVHRIKLGLPSAAAPEVFAALAAYRPVIARYADA